MLEIPIFGFDLKKHSATIYDSGSEPVSCSTTVTIGKAVAATLQKADETKNRWVKIFSVQATQNDLLHSLEKETGKTWEQTAVSTDKVLEDARAKMADGDFVGGYLGFLAVQLFARGEGRSIMCSAEDSDNALLGLPSETAEGIVKNVLARAARTEQ